MISNKINPNGKGKLFQNPYLEFLTKSSPWIIWGMYFPVIVGMLVYSIVYQFLPWYEAVVIYLGGVFSWTFFEYILHRYVFHFVNESKFVQRFHYMAHGFHHEYPRDTEHLFMPPLPSVFLASFFFGIFFLICGRIYVFPFFPGFLTGYLLYATMHYAMHTVKTPPKFLRSLWRYHHLHHFKTPEQAFGVSSSLWDHVFRTLPPDPQKQSSINVA